MAVRTGDQYVQRLKERSPEAWFGGERVANVTEHPAIAPAIQSIAKLYDLQHDAKLRETMVCTDSDDVYGTSFLVPRNAGDLLKRRLMHQAWAEATFGIMGRSTDFMSAMLTAWFVNAHFFGDYADNVRRYFRLVREEDLFLTHTLINPQVDRSKPPSQQPDPYTYLGVVRETDKGLVVRGAKMLATAGPYADEILVWPFGKHSAEDKKYAIAFAIPTNTKGLRMVCREPLTTGNTYDHPLASRFDEMDAIVIFDDVVVPWERVFINQDVERVNNIFKVNSNSLTGHQTSIRLLAKLQFMAGLTILCTDAIQTSGNPVVQDMIGEVTTYIELVRAAIVASEATAQPAADGALLPNVTPLMAIRNSGNRWYPRVREIMQLLLGGGLMYQPASVDIFDSPISGDVRKYYRGATLGAEEKVKLYKAAADLAVSGFGGRHELYERFYSGDPLILRVMTQYQSYDKSEAVALARRMLDGYDVETGLAELRSGSGGQMEPLRRGAAR
jgi:4-hydroxyphenylacetate 3-monooxygenase